MHRYQADSARTTELLMMSQAINTGLFNL